MNLQWTEFPGYEHWDKSDRFVVSKNMNGWWCMDHNDYSDSGIVKTVDDAKEWAHAKVIAEYLSAVGSGRCCQQSEPF